jgi:hypothetical protein
LYGLVGRYGAPTTKPFIVDAKELGVVSSKLLCDALHRTSSDSPIHFTVRGPAVMNERREKYVLVFMHKSDSTRPGPLVFIRQCCCVA